MLHDVARVTAFLESRGARTIAHPGGSLEAHLLRTYGRLATWGADEALALAGLSHAAYGTDGFSPCLLRLDERATLEALVGEHAEALVYAYCAHERDRPLTGRAHDIELRDRFTGVRWSPSLKMLRDLAMLTAANELDVLAHATLGADDRERACAALRQCLDALAPAAREAVNEALGAPAQGRSSDTSIAVRQEGTRGETILFVHGGAPPEVTWERQLELAHDFRLVVPWRRGYPPSAPAHPQDWEEDARDLLRIAPRGSHLVGHSYGAVAVLVAASRVPDRFRSVTVIEPPLWSVAEHAPEVQRLAKLGREFASGASPQERMEFLALASLPSDHVCVPRVEARARGMRDPGEARPSYATLRTLPTLVVSGAHDEGMERVCDALADALGATRMKAVGAGHAVQRLAVFGDRLRAFVSEH